MLTIVIIIPEKFNSDNFGASCSEVAVAAPPGLSSESEDDKPHTQKLEVDTCVMAGGSMCTQSNNS